MQHWLNMMVFIIVQYSPMWNLQKVMINLIETAGVSKYGDQYLLFCFGDIRTKCKRFVPRSILLT